jgi:hypothetical protein
LQTIATAKCEFYCCKGRENFSARKFSERFFHPGCLLNFLNLSLQEQFGAQFIVSIVAIIIIVTIVIIVSIVPSIPS